MSARLVGRRVVLLGAAGVIAAASRARSHDLGEMADMPEQTPSAPVATDKVKIDNFFFTPQTITVPVGATVTWTNQDDIPHLVVAKDHAFRSQPLDTGDSFTHVFAAAGEYPYFCGLHPKMVGTVKVG
ncbi:MAG TPA: cupredoxin family copper-binding protein [Stellaceae bacterium]|nr:cupredoxin family copper-binding protein [Stellaceae bacterium]